MSISSIGSSLLNTLGDTSPSYKDLLSGKNTQELTSEISTVTLASNASLMTKNYSAVSVEQSILVASDTIDYRYTGHDRLRPGSDVDSNVDRNKYMSAAIKSLQLSNNMENSKDSQLFSALDQFGGMTVGAVYVPDSDSNAKTGSESHIKMLLERQGDKQIVKNADDEFQKERDAADKNAEVAEAPKDAEGNPITTGTGTSTEQTTITKDAEGNLDLASTDAELDTTKNDAAEESVAIGIEAAMLQTPAAEPSGISSLAVDAVQVLDAAANDQQNVVGAAVPSTADTANATSTSNGYSINIMV